MTLREYYKKHIFEYGYNVALNTRNKTIAETQAEKKKQLDGIYFNDEMDYYIFADYYGSYVGSQDNWKPEDRNFLSVFGYDTGDFENE